MSVLVPALLLALASVAEPALAGVLRAKPPAGFGDLAGPQTALIDLFFLGEPVGAAPASFVPGHLTFSDPAGLVALLPHLAQPAAVLAALSGQLDTHAELVCGGRRANCGELTPEVAGIVFDSGRFRADIVVDPTMLEPQVLDGMRFLPVPEGGLSAVGTLSGAVAGEVQDSPDYTLTARSTIARADARFETETSASEADGASLDVAALEQDLPDWQRRAGLYRTASLPFLGEHRLVGVGARSSTDLRLDRDQIAGNPLSVFLARRAHVEIRRDGRLLSARSYPAGNQILETRDLPEGAYEVELRIVEADGQERTETQFFAKDTSVPPEGMPRWVLEAGLPSRSGGDGLPDLSTAPLLHAGTTYRVLDRLALGADAAIRTDDQALEVGGVYLHPLATVAASAFAAVSGDAGLGLNLYGSWRRVSYGLNARRIWPADGGEPDDPLDLNGRASSRFGSSLSYSIGRGRRVGLRALWTQPDDGDATYAVTPNLFWPLLTRGGQRVDLVAELSVTDRETLATARLRWEFDRPRYRLSAERGVTAGSWRDLGGDGRDMRVDAVWKDGDMLDGDLQVGAGFAREPNDDLARAETDYVGPAGRADAQIEHRFEGDTRYALGGTVNVLGNRDRITWGGRDALRSGLVVAVEGTGDAAFTVMVDDRPAGRVAVGERLALLLPEYELYDVRLAPVDAPRISFDANPRRVALFPGTVQTLTWSVQPVVVVFGRLVGPDGQPLADARIEGGLEPGYSDGQGYFQIETPGMVGLTVTRPGDEPCGAEIVPGAVEDDLAVLDDVVCG